MKAGARLKAAREAMGLSVEQAGVRLRIRTDYLAALESMNVHLIPGKAYARAYLRSYAKFLGLNVEAVVAQYEAENARFREDADRQVRDPKSKPESGLLSQPWFPVLILGAVAVGFVGWQAVRSGHHETEVVAPAKSRSVIAAAPAPAQPATQVTAPSDAADAPRVEIVALQPLWLEVRGADGTIFYSRTMQAGELYAPDVGAGWTLHTTDGGAFQVRIDGAVAGLLGDSGAPVLGRQVDRLAVREGLTPLPAGQS